MRPYINHQPSPHQQTVPGTPSRTLTQQRKKKRKTSFLIDTIKMVGLPIPLWVYRSVSPQKNIKQKNKIRRKKTCRERCAPCIAKSLKLWRCHLWAESQQGKAFLSSISFRSCVKLRGSSTWKWITRWWFQIFFIFIPIWGNHPIWLLFFRWVETTNQIS